jgi:hypothetical protein
LNWQHSPNTTKKCSSNKTGLDHISDASLDALNEHFGHHVTSNRFTIFGLWMALTTTFSQPNPCHYFLWWFWKTTWTETTPTHRKNNYIFCHQKHCTLSLNTAAVSFPYPLQWFCMVLVHTLQMFSTGSLISHVYCADIKITLLH